MAQAPDFLALKPFLATTEPDEAGEFDCHCPLHEDSRRSARANFELGLFHCFGGCGDYPLAEVVHTVQSQGLIPPEGVSGPSARPRQTEHVNEGHVAGWHERLVSDSELLEWLRQHRGIAQDTIEHYQIGWDPQERCYTIPIRDDEGKLANVRRYRPPRGGRGSHYWSVRGMGTRRLWPLEKLAHDNVIIAEGEWDALLLNQMGLPAVTGTGGAGNWRSDWASAFADKRVWVIYDADKQGKEGAEEVARSLEMVAEQVAVVTLPYEHRDKGGEDITDYIVRDGHTRDDVVDLLNSATEMATAGQSEAAPVSLADTLDASLYGQMLATTATITGKINPPYQVPREVRYTCNQDKGQICALCPMSTRWGGDATGVIRQDDPVLLEVMNVTNSQVRKPLLRAMGIPPSCDRVNAQPQTYQAIEELFARPNIEHQEEDSADEHINRKILSVGRHDTSANQTVRLEGSIHPDPKTQRSQFLAHSLEATESSIDSFKLSEESWERLLMFQPRPGQRPLRRAGDIARDLAANVTKIKGRPELHIAMDLTWHSVLGFRLGDERVNKGWVELLVVGDTRTGKSAAAEAMQRHYGMGKMVSCESASFAGIVGGLQQFGAGREWTITWGAVPLNDRRLVVLDEISGMTTDQISEMSSIRSSGIAQLTKIQTEQTNARTRLIWMGNPRNGSMAEYTYAIHAIPPLIGNPEDIARFDLAMSASAHDVPSALINDPAAREDVSHTFDAQSCHELLLWVWSRRADQVRWSDEAVAEVFSAAQRLGESYIEDPPLIQAANVRVKVARLAAALAARTFSTHDGVHLEVERRHVVDAVKFIEHIYGLDTFGYARVSQEAIEDAQVAKERIEDIKRYIYEHRGLAKFLRSAPEGFRARDIEEVLNKSRDEATAIVNKLYDARMVTMSRGGVIRMRPQLNQALRQMKG